ncbi:type II toxin-antitoxin system HipA family toxin [Adlercreutzia sp. ZJ473]|uniref:type II toxin-antitoxin system HipA family toxin n=1 Tax=Adlercreutzia sp. ZJ473 TaxID=2722822 RepID=UPI001552E829|nr:type II toxin-antitoxin system HipA family toxin [Adlercreutzia sp. ZJ473]
MELAVTVQLCGEDVLAGRLYTHVRHGVESASFTYDAAYLALPRAIALDPSMPLAAGTLHAGSSPMFRAFEDCMPDRWGRNLMLRAERATAREEGRAARSLFEGDLLAGVSDETRQGALRFWQEGIALAPSASGVPREVSIPALLTSADRAARDMDADVRDLLAAGSSLGGARPKASVRDERGVLNVAKFPKADELPDEDVCAWENVAAHLARRAGMRVPPARILRVSGRSVLLLERFDREGERRIPYISGLTAVQGTDGERYSYLDLVEFLEENGSAPGEDLPELWRRALLSCAIGNVDNHLRNYGFLHDGRGWRLAPSFDVNPTPGDELKYLNTALDYEAIEALPQVAVSVCEYFRVSVEEARATCANMARVLGGWRKAARSNGISASSIAGMASCFDGAVERLRSCAQGGR